MTSPKRSSLVAIPEHVRKTERFGVGKFSADDRIAKCEKIRVIMEKRPALVDPPLFSVVVPVHREAEYLLGTLHSLATQKHRNTEFIIVSNGESRGNLTQRMAEESGFTVIHEPKAGVARARQRGLEAAQGKIIVTTDGDTLHTRDWLNGIEQEWNTKPDLVGGFGWVHALSHSMLYYMCIDLQNLWRTVQGHKLVFGAAEANSWFLRDAAMHVGGYDIHTHYFEGSILLRKLHEFGKISCATSAETAVYTSDRRMIFERLAAMAQYCTSVEAKNVRYAVVR